jgi:hypothetical protein
MANATPASLKIKINLHLSPVRNTIILKKKAKNTSCYSVCSQFYNTGKTKQNSLVPSGPEAHYNMNYDSSFLYSTSTIHF